MTLPTHDTVLSQFHDLLADHGFDGRADALTVLLNEVMKIERSQHLQAQLYERTEQRRGYANGYKPKTVKTRVGELTVSVPQVRDGDFYPQRAGERAAQRTGAQGRPGRNVRAGHLHTQGGGHYRRDVQL